MPPTGAASVALGALLGVAALAGADAYGFKLDQQTLAVIVALLAGLCGVLMLLAPAPTKSGALPDCPATSWPAGKPMLASPSDYPTYDHVNDPKGSFMKICDMMIADVKDELAHARCAHAEAHECIHLHTMVHQCTHVLKIRSATYGTAWKPYCPTLGTNVYGPV